MRIFRLHFFCVGLEKGEHACKWESGSNGEHDSIPIATVQESYSHKIFNMRKTTTTAASHEKVKEDYSRKRQISQSLDASASSPTAADVEYKMLCEKHRITDSKEYPPKEYLIKIHGIPTVTVGDVHLIQGQAKTGKTAFLRTMIVALLLGKLGVMERAIVRPLKIIMFDTEQFTCDTANQYRHILKACNMKEDLTLLQVHNIRSMGYQERRKYILETVKREKPNLVIIDGVRDLVLDINSSTECPILVQELMEMASSIPCAVVAGLHNNFGQDKARGWLGSELLNKIGYSFEPTKDGNVVRVKNPVFRGAPVPDLVFTFDTNGNPILDQEFVNHMVQVNNEAKEREKQEKKKENAEKRKEKSVKDKEANTEKRINLIRTILLDKGSLKKSELVKEMVANGDNRTDAYKFIAQQLADEESPVIERNGKISIKPVVVQTELFT